MPKNAENWIEDLDDMRLPALGHSKRQLDAILDRPATGHSDLSAIVSLDPGLSIQLFRELSQHPQQPKDAVSNPTRIVSLLGMAKVHNMAAKIPTLEQRYRGPALNGLRRCYGRAILAARFARLLSSLRARSNTEESAVTALLQGIGEMALWAKRPGTMNLLLTGVQRQEDVDLASIRRFETRPSDLGASLARHWHLPQNIILAQHLHNSMDGNVLLPLLAADLAWSAFRNWQTQVTEELIQLAAELVHLDPDIVRPALYKEAAEAARLAYARELPHAADGILLAPDASRWTATPDSSIPSGKSAPASSAQPGTTSSNLEKSSSSASRGQQIRRPAPTHSAANAGLRTAKAIPTQLSAPAAQQAAPKPAAKPVDRKPSQQTVPAPAAQEAAIRPAMVPDNLKTLQKAAQAPGPAKSARLVRLEQALQRLREDAGMDRVLFAMLTLDRTELRGRMVLEDKSSNLSDFKVPAQTRNLFALLLAKPHALWINKGNHSKYLHLVPGQAAALISSKGFFVVSILARQRPIGLIYGDANTGGLDANKFETFKKTLPPGEQAVWLKRVTTLESSVGRGSAPTQQMNPL